MCRGRPVCLPGRQPASRTAAVMDVQRANTQVRPYNYSFIPPRILEPFSPKKKSTAAGMECPLQSSVCQALIKPDTGGWLGYFAFGVNRGFPSSLNSFIACCASFSVIQSMKRLARLYLAFEQCVLSMAMTLY